VTDDDVFDMTAFTKYVAVPVLAHLYDAVSVYLVLLLYGDGYMTMGGNVWTAVQLEVEVPLHSVNVTVIDAGSVPDFAVVTAADTVTHPLARPAHEVGTEGSAVVIEAYDAVAVACAVAGTAATTATDTATAAIRRTAGFSTLSNVDRRPDEPRRATGRVREP
jgi:hypothetical protein